MIYPTSCPCYLLTITIHIPALVVLIFFKYLLNTSASDEV